MEVEFALIPTPRPMFRSQDTMRVGRPFRQDEQEKSRASNEMARPSIDQGPGPATLETTPPRAGQRLDDRAPSHTTPLTAEETIKLFKRKIEVAREETQNALAGGQEVSEVVKPTLTLDLGRSNIARLPESIIDLIKSDVERLSLSHNQLWVLPSRMPECLQLRYLNIRTNNFREIPKGVYQMPLLEILDISRNRITRIAKDVKKLESLRVLSIQHNRLKELPHEITELTKLRIIKVAENPFKFELKKLIEAKEAEVAYAEMIENERDAAMTIELMRYLRDQHHPQNTTTPVIEAAEWNESPQETPKPLRRALSGRFPVVPAAVSTETSTENSDSPPYQGHPPTIPTKSHLRGASGHSIVLRRPGVAPVVNGNERNRSNSESVLQASAAARHKRMGIVRKEKSDLDSIDETKVARHSHMRGVSYASALRKNGSISSPGGNSSSPNSPKDGRKPRTLFVKRLSSLPEYKIGDETSTPIIEGAKGVLYALYQIHPQISGLIAAATGKDARRGSLEITFYNASVQVDRLNVALEHAESVDLEDEEGLEHAEETVHRDCATCIMAFSHVITQMQENVRKLVDSADPRYVRTLMLLLYGSIIEITNAIKNFEMESKSHHRQISSGTKHPIQTIPEEASPAKGPSKTDNSTRDLNAMTLRPGPRLRSDTVLQHPGDQHQNLHTLQPPPPMPHLMNLNGSTHSGTYSRTSSAGGSVSSRSFGIRSRSNSRHTNYASGADSSLASMGTTPRSSEAFNIPPPPLTARINPVTGMTDGQEEADFEQIFLALTKSYEASLQALPIVRKQFQRCLESAEEERQSKEIRELWLALLHRCKYCLDLSEALQIRLTNMRIRDTNSHINNTGIGRNDPSFWNLCKTFLQSFVDMVTDMREAKDLKLLPPEIVALLRPIQKASRDAGRLIETSPWRYLTDGVVNMATSTPFNGHLNDGSHLQHLNNYATQSFGPVSHNHVNHINGGYLSAAHSANAASTSLPSLLTTPSLHPSYPASNGASPLSAQLPATPMSAALGPAIQATVPSTPASAYGDSFFKGDVFQRADSLLNMPQAAGSVNFLNRR